MDSESYWPQMNVGLGIGAAGDGRGQGGARTKIDSLYVLLCRPLTGTSANQQPHRKSRPLATANTPFTLAT